MSVCAQSVGAGYINTTVNPATSVIYVGTQGSIGCFSSNGQIWSMIGDLLPLNTYDSLYFVCFPLSLDVIQVAKYCVCSID